MITTETAARIIAIADRESPNGASASAVLCLQDARSCLARGDAEHAAHRALKSLAYSACVFSDAYKEAEALIGRA